MGIVICDDLAQECYGLNTALVAIGFLVYGFTVFFYGFGKAYGKWLARQ